MEPDKLDLAKLLPEARALVSKVVQNNMAEGILFSAGTDTSIIAYEAVKFDPNIKAITVSFKQGKPKDTEYVKKMVDFLKLDHEFHIFEVEDVINAAKDVVKVLKTFDPMDVRNTLPAYIGLTVAKKKGIKSVLTGDALDELFGYPWQFHLSETDFAKALSDMWGEMTFSSTPMGNSVGITVKQPYLDPLFMDYAKKLPVNLKVNFENGVKYGKWLLRKAYDGFIPDEVVWRGKAPLEQGTGTWVLPDYFDKEISTDDFEEKKKLYLDQDDVILTSKEQLVYYETFRELFGKPSEVYADSSGRQCPKCKGYVKTKVGFCRICGNYPI
ncbi:MAG: asparagine synthase-related protein [Candidatus Bathyarchaeota archaeon]|nr:asparagine synthase-related protein [Candidatus Bathyarchaeum sp.]